MSSPNSPSEIAELQRRLEEAEETIRAIKSGAVDAVVVEQPDGHRVYTIETADRPYRLFVEEMQQGAATLHSDGTIVWCNRRLAEMLKHPHERLFGASLRNFITAPDHAIYDNLLWQGQTRSGRGEARLQRADGGIVAAYLTFNSLPEDIGAAIGVLITDLTAQRHHEQLSAAHQALRESEARNAAIVSTAIDGIITIDHTGRVVEFNPAAERIFGYRRGEVLGKDMAELIIPPPLWESHRRGIARYLATGEGPMLNRVLELQAVRAGGATFTVEAAITCISKEGPPVFTGYIRDITERKRLEEELRQYVADLSDADRRKNEFLAMLAHELRNPLAPICSALQIVRRGQTQDSDFQSASDIMEHQVIHLVRLVDDLLDVSRITQGKIELRLERVQLNAVIQRAVEACRPTVERAKQSLSVNLPSRPLYLDGDPIRLAQAFSNLINNACKYSQPGGNIWLAAEIAGVAPGREECKAEAIVRVRDTGIGIPREMLPRIFDLFMQVDRSLERSQGGLGIGLTLVKRLIELHGGSVCVSSGGPGQGSEFVVRLPLQEDGPAAQAAPRDAHRSPLAAPCRILVVDDNRDAAETLAMLLKFSGHSLVTAADGLEALQAVEAFHPDVVLLDIGLPKLNGYEVARQLRAKAAHKHLVLIALTGWGQEDDRRKSAEAGFNAHLVKPVDLAALNTLLADLLQAD